jgi:hypothetical protein
VPWDERDFRRELASISSFAMQKQAVSHWPSTGSESVFSPEFRVARAVLEGHQEIDAQPNQLTDIPSEHGGSPLIGVPDHASVIHYQDGVRRRIEDFSEQGIREHDAL